MIEIDENELIRYLEREYGYIYQNEEYTGYRMGYLAAIHDLYDTLQARKEQQNGEKTQGI